MMLFAATNAALAYLVKGFLNGAFVKRNPQVLWQVPIGVLVLFTLRGIGDYVANYYPSWVGRQVIKGLRRDVFSHYLRLPTAYLDRQQSGHLLSKLTNNIELVAAAATSAAISLIGDSLTIIGLLITLFYMNWRLALFCIAAAPVIAWLMQIANRSFRRYSERIQNSMGDITRVAKEAIDAHRLIKIFNAEDHQTEQIRTGQRTESRVEHEARARQIDQQSGGLLHCIDRSRQRALRGDTAGIFPQHASGRVLRVSDRVDAHSRAFAQPGQHERALAAGHRRGPERVRHHGSADRGQRRDSHHRARTR